MRTNFRAEKIEAQVWETVSGILTDPEQFVQGSGRHD